MRHITEHDIIEEHEGGKVRILCVPDEMVDYDNLVGDMFTPKYHPDIDLEQLQKEEKEFQERVDCEGVWGIIGEYWNGEEWEQADSCWGFVGGDVKTSGYLEDIRKTTIEAYKAQQHCPTCQRPKLA